MEIEVSHFQTGKAAICAPILQALPQWFGIEEANQHYIAYTEANPTCVAYANDSAVGFLSLARPFPHAAEIYVMGVLPDYHRHGVGRALIDATEMHLRQEGVKFLQVKTLSDKHPDEGYQRTRAFYFKMGFQPLEEFPDLWGAHNPCLQLIKYLY